MRFTRLQFGRMKPNTVAAHPAESGGMISWTRWLDSLGRSDTTGWRWRRAGLVRPVNIFGKLYITREDREQFEARAARGEFSKPSTGAAITKQEAINA